MSDAIEVLRKHFNFEECEGCFGCDWNISVVNNKVQFKCLSCGNIYRFVEKDIRIRRGINP